MNDMTPVIAAKSDQLNADDLYGGPLTITITKVEVRDTKDQPVSVFYQGDDGKPFKPCKSMARVMVAAWGADSKAYAGKSMTVYRDQAVKWAGIEVGGIRISHMSDLAEPLLIAITLTKGSKKPYRVEPLAGGQGDDGAADMAADLIRRAEALRGDAAGLAELAAKEGIIKRRAWLLNASPALSAKVDAAFIPTTPDDTADNPTAAEGPADDDRGEATPEWVEAHDAHMARVQSATSMADLNAAISDFTVWVSDLPDDVRENVEAEERKASDRLNIAAGG